MDHRDKETTDRR